MAMVNLTMLFLGEINVKVLQLYFPSRHLAGPFHYYPRSSLHDLVPCHVYPSFIPPSLSGLVNPHVPLMLAAFGVLTADMGSLAAVAPYPDENKGGNILAVCLIMTMLALIAVLVRMYVRMKVVHGVGLDDFAILIAMV